MLGTVPSSIFTVSVYFAAFLVTISVENLWSAAILVLTNVKTAKARFSMEIVTNNAAK